MSFKETKTRGGEIPAKNIKMYVIEDNDACIKIVLKKRSMALRHVMRTHRVALDWLYELFDSEDIWLKYINTKWQVADMYTKSFTNAGTWRTLCSLNSIGPPNCDVCIVPPAAANAPRRQNGIDKDVDECSGSPAITWQTSGKVSYY